jgi:hypothetical protein
MNRVLKRPMFRIGGSAGTGITSGLDQPRKQYAQGSEDKFMELVAELREQGFTQQEAIEEARRRLDMAKGGRVGYANGTQMPNFQMGGLPGFLTGFGLNLLATPPRGNIFQTAATAAQDPFNRLQASQAAAMKTASDRAFAEKLAKEEREFEEGQLDKRLAVEREKIDKMGGTDITKRLEAAREEFGDDIKAARAVEFADTKFKEFEDKFGEGQVATTVIDSDGYQRKGSLEKFVKQNPRIAGLKIYDVATNKVVIIVTDTATGRLKLVPADSADIDTTGDTQPAPRENPGLFGQPTKPGKELKEILPDFRDSGFDEDFYQ